MSSLTQSFKSVGIMAMSSLPAVPYLAQAGGMSTSDYLSAVFRTVIEQLMHSLEEAFGGDP